MRYLRHKDLVEKGISYSKNAIWRLTRLPADDPRKFPDPIKGLGPENVWAEPHVEEYLKRRVDAAVRGNKAA